MPGVSTLSRILFVLMTLRLLLPPGICICKTSSAGSHFLQAVLHGDVPSSPDAQEEDDDHNPGCPASVFATGLGVKPPAGPFFTPPQICNLAIPVSPIVSSGDEAPPVPLSPRHPFPRPDA